MKATRAGLLVALILIASPARADAPALRIGSKTFAESVILSQAAALLAAGAGTPVDDRGALGGTRLCWDALMAGALDLYPEYTGTLREEILKDPTAGDLEGLRSLLAARGLDFVGPLGFDNGYALAMRESVAARLGIRTLSDLAEARHGDLRFGLSNEFMRRRDGWPGLAAQYGFAPGRAQGLDHELAIRGLLDGAVDVTDVYTTDAEIRRAGLRVLADDRGFFPRYQAILLHRRDAEARWPAAFAALRRLTGRLDAPTMIALNARAKLDKIPERAVAADFLAQRLGVHATDGVTPEARWPTLWRRTREHLALVAVSLAAAIACALPLGILAARRRRVGQVVLALVGIVQTIPSLALLVFMIPLVGIGAWPATAALFLYSLLPIVRNTHAGLTGIPAPLRESAEALGLTPGAILWRIELPLASGTILAGIQSAAVINIGTATLGALVGAGGYGQPIFAGIRLDDVSLILEGAIPASLLALVVQGLFEVIERGCRQYRVDRDG
ncbi:MAG TPA: glycine betaine ABC transporter substrate-binding protein [Polyangia bacterium]|nr:glycine betaine ABC transporter substrate-binding protein [Polyangia bacterium]